MILEEVISRFLFNKAESSTGEKQPASPEKGGISGKENQGATEADSSERAEGAAPATFDHGNPAEPVIH